MEAQISLTVSESKRVIAKAVTLLPEVRKAFKNGRIILKGGTTVSAVCEEMIGIPLRISGRITEKGALAARSPKREHPHSALIENGTMINIDDSIHEIARGFGRKDVVIISGNALDMNGNVAMMAGAPGGGNPGLAIAAMLTQGARIIIPIGLEKLIPVSIQAAVKAAGRDIDLAYGMAVGLIPIVGKVVTEKDAVEIVAPVRCTVIGRGGIYGAEGATVMAVSGPKEAVEMLLEIVEQIKGAKLSGEPSSLTACDGPGVQCSGHRACIYKKARKK